MTCQEHELDLGDYVDGTLDGPARAAFQAHLSSCARCRALAADFRALRQAAMALEPEAPSPRVWARLSAALEAERAGTPLRWGFTWQTLAASMAAVVVVASLSWVGARLAPVGRDGGRLASQGAGQPIETASVATEFAMVEAQFTSAIAGLEVIARSDRAALDMDTADVVQANLTVIDGAINESRAALVAEPDSRVAQQSLFDAMRSKIELLQDVVALINEMRKGDPEGAARIVSGSSQ